MVGLVGIWQNNGEPSHPDEKHRFMIQMQRWVRITNEHLWQQSSNLVIPIVSMAEWLEFQTWLIPHEGKSTENNKERCKYSSQWIKTDLCWISTPREVDVMRFQPEDLQLESSCCLILPSACHDPRPENDTVWCTQQKQRIDILDMINIELWIVKWFCFSLEITIVFQRFNTYLEYVGAL